MGVSSGRVTLKKVWVEVAPSMLAASNIFWSMPMIPAISNMVVLPNHSRKFIRQIRLRTVILMAKKSMGFSAIPICISSWFTGPTLENRV